MRPRLPLAGARPLLAFFQRAISITPAVSKAADHQYTSARFLYDLDSQSTPRSSGSTPKTTATAGNYYNGTQRQEQERQRQRQPGDPTAAAAAAPSSEPLQNLLYNNHRTRATKQRREERTRRDEQRRVSQEYLQQMPRMWRDGDVLAPHDLSGSEMRKWRKRAPRTADVIDLLGINPLDHYSVSNGEALSHRAGGEFFADDE